MDSIKFHVLRIGLAITFLWIGILILQNPSAWGAYIQPWVTDMLPVSTEVVMYGAGILDLLLGALLLFDVLTWLGSVVGTLHLVIILIVSGVNAITVRDIGLIGAMLALTLHVWPTQKERPSDKGNPSSPIS